MKKFLAIIFSAAILAVSAIALSGCGCSKDESEVSRTPDTDIVGSWGERSDDVEVEFNDDGTCTIGGINGTYQIDDENRLTVTPNTEEGSNESAEPLVFEYYNGDGNFSSVPQNQWAISDNKLYINGYQYSKETTDSSSADNTFNNTSSNANNGSSNQSASNSSSSSKPSSNNSSNNSAENKPDNSSSNSSSSTNKPDNGSSNTEGSSDPNSSSSAPIQIEEGEEKEVVNIYENLDNF